MDLNTYIEMKRMQIKEFAELIGVHPSSISNYIHRNRRPNLDIANRIEKATKGRVTIEDLLAYRSAKKTHE